MKTATLEAWAWILIDGGLLLAGLALLVARNDAELGWAVASTGGGLLGAGLLSIDLRSRMPECPNAQLSECPIERMLD